MKKYFFLIIFIAQILGASVDSNLASDWQKISNNVQDILHNSGQILGSFSTFACKCTKGATGFTSYCLHKINTYPKSFAAASILGSSYALWRIYDTFRFERHIEAARYFLSPAIPTSDTPAAPAESTLKIVQCDIAHLTNQAVLNQYLERTNRLIDSLRRYSQLRDIISTCTNEIDHIEQGNVTDAQRNSIEHAVQARITCIGLPYNYGWLSCLPAWYQRCVSPYRQNYTVGQMCASYAKGALFAYESIATELSWELFKKKIDLQDRLGALQNQS